MRFQWDPKKNRENIQKHGLDFVDAPQVFEGPLLARPDTREDYGEERWQGVGNIRGRVVAVVFATIGAETIRIISLRKANSYERAQYEKAIADELGTS
ncbi:MAG: BrnT family toxin [Terriglobales bacterium]